MEEAMLSIMNLPQQVQEEILKGMSHEGDEVVPIEINGDVFEVAYPVMSLIEGLHRELEKYREQGKFGIEENKKN